ncbi:unnamed protein product [Dibothriocephalus latus]|uniref:Uncharacterized protein n=1 Tax=Dibothriocephalus latus TaxID=60516 RepID=A0A3P7LHY2_DIBLA|nr:unnamed protein product [Dibothriocephalus latus]
MNQNNISAGAKKSKNKNKRKKNRDQNQNAAESQANQGIGNKSPIPAKTEKSAVNKPAVLSSKPEQQPATSAPNQTKSSKKQRKRRRKSASQPHEIASSAGPLAKRVKTAEDSEIIPYLKEEQQDSDDSEEIEVESLGDPTDESSSDFAFSDSDSDDDEDEDDDDEERGEQEPPIEPISEANALFRALIEPVSTDVFTKDYYGKKPLHLSGGGVRAHFRSIFSLSEVATWLYKVGIFFIPVDIVVLVFKLKSFPSPPALY